MSLLRSENIYTLLIIISAIPLTYLFTKIIIAAASKVRFINQPNPIVGIHKRPVAYGGGLAVSVCIVFSMLFLYKGVPASFIFILLTVVMAGLLDDIFKLSPLLKITIESISVIPFLLTHTDINIFFILFFLFVIVSSQNAWNLIDIMDGLTSGVSILVFFTAGIILIKEQGLQMFSVAAFITASSLYGFRFLNKAPAKIFLGETGTLFLGSLFAFIVIITLKTNFITAIYLLLLGSIPFFELLFLIIVRTKKRIPFYKGSPDHFALRLLHNGLTVNSVNQRVLIVCAVQCIIIVIGSTFRNITILVSIMLFTLASAIVAYEYFRKLPGKEFAAV